jgi:Tol biopolymer transport system component
VEVLDLDFPDSLYAGLFVCSHNKDVTETAVFENVQIILPAPTDFRPYQDYIGSNMEILDVQTGLRKILFTTPEVIQAPNWTPDGKALIYNSHGLIFRYDVATGEHSQINTDFVNQNNNDHVISFDGSMLGLSSSSVDH